MKEYKKYSDIPEEYRFDLEFLLGGKKIEELIEELIQLSRKTIENKDSKYESPEKYLEAMELEREIGILFNRVSNYISNYISTNVVDAKMNKLASDFDYQMDEISKQKGSELNRFFEHADKMQEWKDLPSFANYKKGIEELLELKKHKLSNEIEEYLNQSARGETSPENTFSILADSEVDFGYAISSKGKKTKITEGNRLKLSKSKDESIRKTAYENYLEGFYKHRQSFASLLNDHIKKISVDAKMRNYDSAVESLISPDHADIKLLNIVYQNVQKHGALFAKFKEAHKKFFKAKYGKKMELWDSNMNLVDIDPTYEIDEAQNLFLNSIQPMGEEYVSVCEEAFRKRWVDYYNVPNKRSGAYSIGNHYGIEKIYILMNWDFTLNSVSTLAHEMGHSMHSYYSDKHQPYELSDYPIFLAEIASIFNELMLLDYLLKNTTNEKLKFQLLYNSIQDFEGTVRRQALWSNYEFELYNASDKGQSLSSYEEFENIYQQIYRKFYPEYQNKKFPNPKSHIYSVTVPHFYYGFYVYKYAIGYIVANVFFQKYKEEGPSALQDYINKFLSSGSRDWPIEILKDAGVDLYDQTIYDQAFKVLEEKIAEFIKIGNKIFKNKI